MLRPHCDYIKTLVDLFEEIPRGSKLLKDLVSYVLGDRELKGCCELVESSSTATPDILNHKF